MGYRDEMEAARQRVAALERELAEHDGGGDRLPLALEVRELRRRIASLSREAADGRSARLRAESAESELGMVRKRLEELERATELVQQELQRRRREHEVLWRKAALASVHVREAERLREGLREQSRSLEQEVRRADRAEIELIRTRMRLSIEKTRPTVDVPWPRDALARCPDRLGAILALDSLQRARDEVLAERLEALTLLIADLVWNSEDATKPFGELVTLLQAVGHTLQPHDHVRLGPTPYDAAGLRIALGPLALRVEFARPPEDGGPTVSIVSSIADDEPLTTVFRRR